MLDGLPKRTLRRSISIAMSVGLMITIGSSTHSPSRRTLWVTFIWRRIALIASSMASMALSRTWASLARLEPSASAM